MQSAAPLKSRAQSRDTKPSPEPVIRTRFLSRRFEMGGSEIHAIDGVDVAIRRGEFCAIMGPSGSGKSTLMNVIGCLDSPDDGEYWLNGNLVSNMKPKQLARIRNTEIGFVFQTFNLLSNASAFQNVEIPLIYSGMKRRERRNKVSAVLGQVGLGDRIWHKPGELSGGQRQRVAIARALVTEPSIVLADEPTGNLDSVTAAEILRLFHTLHAAGNTIVIVTHDSSVAKHAERVLTMVDGKVLHDIKRDF